ncbi:MAG: ABC transporter ATP-binding protein [Phycisphaerales bacterium]|nr:ABC transporter ATP-binding protein [Phycisphaerales bacterium]
MAASATTSQQPISANDSGGVNDTRKPVVGCQQLSKVFKDFWMRDRARAVDKLDLVIYEHEVFGLLGPNGSGKSTIIKLILGLLQPTHGRVSVFGKPPSDVATKKRIGYLPEESYLYPFLNARETLDYYGKLFGLDKKTREGRIDELLEMVGLEHAQFRPVREYSKGMQRRIGIAQALINDPDLLILDEPTTGLDPIGTRQVKDLILELGRRGKTIILSSHLLTDVEDVVDRMAILYGGKIRDEGTCEGLLASKERTLIETDELDDQTIAEIDEVIRRRTGGQKSIRKVSAPRQKLEELFLGIVEKAQTEKASTSGAMQGGSTAAFLRAQEDSVQHGEALIDSLLNDSAADSSAQTQANDAQVVPQSTQNEALNESQSDDSGLIDSLMESDAQTGSSNEPSADGKTQPQAPAEHVDLGVIGSLLDDEQVDQDDQGDADSEAGDKESNR